MARKSSITKTRLYKIIMRWEWADTKPDSRIVATRLYQSKATFDRSWKSLFLHLTGAHYDAYELKNSKWLHIGKKTLKPRKSTSDGRLPGCRDTLEGPPGGWID